MLLGWHKMMHQCLVGFLKACDGLSGCWIWSAQSNRTRSPSILSSPVPSCGQLSENSHFHLFSFSDSASSGSCPNRLNFCPQQKEGDLFPKQHLKYFCLSTSSAHGLACQGGCFSWCFCCCRPASLLCRKGLFWHVVSAWILE